MSKKKKKKNKKFYSLRKDLKRSLFIVFLFVFSFTAFLSFVNLAGSFGKFLNHYFSIILGSSKYFLVFLTFIWAIYYYIWSRKSKRLKYLLFTHYLGAFLMLLSSSSLNTALVWFRASSLNRNFNYLISEIAQYNGGGYLGFAFFALLVKFLGFILSILMLISIFISSILLVFQISLADLVKKTYVLDYLYKSLLFVLSGFKDLFVFLFNVFSSILQKNNKAENTDLLLEDEDPLFKKNLDDLDKISFVEDEIPVESYPIIEDNNELKENNEKIDLIETNEEENEIADVPVFDTSEGQIINNGSLNMELDKNENRLFPYQTQELLDYKCILDNKLLEASTDKPKSGDIKHKAQQIKNTLKNFGINVEMQDVKVGPVVTQFAFKPADGIKLSRITALHDDLALALAAHPIRIEAPIPGRPFVGLEVPNQQSAIVRMRDLLNSKEFKMRKNNMQIILGKDVSGSKWITDLSKMPHLLVAGQTGSGKSVCLNSIIISLLYQNDPKELRFIMVDPKRVELSLYNGIPHLLTEVITDIQKTLNALKWAVSEMDRRYQILAERGKRNIASFNETSKEKMPYIVFIIDELADIMVTAGREVETYIVRLTQMARAVGIHLVIATQRPSVNVITGLIKANIPARIAFSVSSIADSRTILDKAGAEKLIGKGDMLFVDPKDDKARRIQGVYISDEEIKKIVNQLKSKMEIPVDYYENVVEVNNNSDISSGVVGGSFNSDKDKDPLYSQAVDIVLKNKKASASYLQRRLRIGFTRAARLIDLMEEDGIVGPAQGAKAREILLDSNSDVIIKTD